MKTDNSPRWMSADELRKAEAESAQREYEHRMRKLALDVQCWMTHPRLGLLLELEDE